jgi:poly(3-hydroxyoctanoate) depolymerase
MGIGGNMEMWRPFEQALAGSGIQTITFDAPGVGESTNWRRPRRMGALARTVDRLVGALGYDEVDVLGVSFGGALAQQLVRQSPDRVRRLVLAATAPHLRERRGVGGAAALVGAAFRFAQGAAVAERPVQPVVQALGEAGELRVSPSTTTQRPSIPAPRT